MQGHNPSNVMPMSKRAAFPVTQSSSGPPHHCPLTHFISISETCLILSRNKTLRAGVTYFQRVTEIADHVPDSDVKADFKDARKREQ